MRAVQCFCAGLVLAMFVTAPAVSAQAESVQARIAADPVLTAMRKELDRAKELDIAAMEDVYFVSYHLDDSRNFSVSASLGAITRKQSTRIRMPRVQVRVGSYDFDNTNYVFTDLFAGRTGTAPLDDDVIALRSHFWLATDRAYKGSLAALSRKRAALKNVNLPEELPDFAKADPQVLILPPDEQSVDEKTWTDRLRTLSGLFANYSEITMSRVRFESIQSTTYLATSEGTTARYPENLHYIEVRAETQAADGMMLRDADAVERLDMRRMPPEAEVANRVRRVAENLLALREASVGESYAGPVLFEGVASAQLFAQVLGDNLAVSRRPVPEPGRNIPFQASELDGRLGSRVLPDWISVVDDPTITEWHGQPLAGFYQMDIEGVIPKPVTVVEKGLLKAFLLTRQPVKGFEESNGRARLPGRFGANSGMFGNLVVHASETVSEEDLRKRLIELCVARDKPYGIVIRKLDFPTSASPDEIRRMSMSSSERGGARLVSPPLLVYRVYPDGREELLRGLDFRGLDARLLRDIVAASDTNHVFNFLGNNAPLSMMGAGGYVTALGVVAPSVLLEDAELDRTVEELPTLPLVPPPPLSTD